MTTYVNTASPASSGIDIGKDPEYQTSIPDHETLVGGTTDTTLDGRPSLDVIARPRKRGPFKFVGLTNTQWTALRTKLNANSTLYWRFPHEGADTLWIRREECTPTPRRLAGDGLTTPHWDVENITLDEVV